jgi:hypothetical protein
MITRFCACFAFLGLLLVASIRADIPNPRRQSERQPDRPQETRIVAPVVIRNGGIRGEGRSIQAKIVIPRHLLPAGEEVIRPRRGTTAPLPEEARAGTPLRTIVAGVAMSLAAVSMVFVIRGNRNFKTAAVAAFAGIIVLGGLGIAVADIAPSPRPRPQANAPAPPPRIANADSEIVIELSDEGDTVTLLLAR